jgi:hypothetical protein
MEGNSTISPKNCPQTEEDVGNDGRHKTRWKREDGRWKQDGRKKDRAGALR